MRNSILITMVKQLLLFVWVYAAVSKLVDYRLFVQQLQLSPFIGPAHAIIAPLLVATELLIAFLLPSKRFSDTGLAASAGLLLVFTGYIGAVLAFSPYVPCSCGGLIGTMSWEAHIVFNLVLAGMALAGLYVQRYPNAGDPGSGPG